MPLADYPIRLRPYVFHGLDFAVPKEGEENVRMDCPFCDKEGHFYIEITTGRWYCQRCSENGNPLVFMRKLYDISFNSTSEESLEELAEERKISVETLRSWGVCLHYFHQDPLVPTIGYGGKITNLHRYTTIKKRNVLIGTPGCKAYLWGTDRIDSKNGQIWITEGIWDAMALQEALDDIYQKRPTTWGKGKPKQHVIAVPGANSFKADWASIFYRRKVTICFDNDHPKENGMIPGWKGTLKTAAIVTRTAKYTKLLKWGEDGYNQRLKDGFDIRDLLSKRKPFEAYEYIKKHLIDPPEDLEEVANTKDIAPLARNTFNSLLEDYSAKLHMTQPLTQTLAVMLATVASTTMKGDPIWFRVIGPPGSGKSTLAEGLAAAREYVLSKSVITGFHSGFTAGMGGKDASLIPKMQYKTFIIKDADTLMQSKNKQSIFADLRDIFDGASRMQTRTGVSKNYEDIRTTVVICGTDTLRIHKKDEASLGERFLDCDCFDDTLDDSPYLHAAFENQISDMKKSFIAEDPAEEEIDVIKAATYGYIQYLKEMVEDGHLPHHTADSKKKVIQMGRFLAWMRTRRKVVKEDDDPEFPVRTELATRLVKQLAKLSTCLAIVLNKPTVDEECLDILRKVVRDSSQQYHYILLSAIASQGEITYKGAAKSVGLSETQVSRILRNMHELKMLRRRTKTNGTGLGGRQVHHYRLSPEMKLAAKAMNLL